MSKVSPKKIFLFQCAPNRTIHSNFCRKLSLRCKPQSELLQNAQKLCNLFFFFWVEKYVNLLNVLDQFIISQSYWMYLSCWGKKASSKRNDVTKSLPFIRRHGYQKRRVRMKAPYCRLRELEECLDSNVLIFSTKKIDERSKLQKSDQVL